MSSNIKGAGTPHCQRGGKAVPSRKTFICCTRKGHLVPSHQSMDYALMTTRVSSGPAVVAADCLLLPGPRVGVGVAPPALRRMPGAPRRTLTGGRPLGSGPGLGWSPEGPGSTWPTWPGHGHPPRIWQRQALPPLLGEIAPQFVQWGLALSLFSPLMPTLFKLPLPFVYVQAFAHTIPSA